MTIFLNILESGAPLQNVIDRSMTVLNKLETFEDALWKQQNFNT